MDQQLSERQMGVVDYFAEQLKTLQDQYNDVYARLQAHVAESAKGLGIDPVKYQLDLATGVFSPLPEPE